MAVTYYLNTAQVGISMATAQHRYAYEQLQRTSTVVTYYLNTAQADISTATAYQYCSNVQKVTTD